MSEKAEPHTIAVLSQLVASGYFPYLRHVELHNSRTVRFVISPEGLEALLKDTERFASGLLYGYHRDVGEDLIDFRSFTGEFGKGSLQIVIDKTTLKGYADCDRWNPYADLVGWFGHAGEVLGSLFGRRKNHTA